MSLPFPKLQTPPPAITDRGTVRLGDACITAIFPPLPQKDRNAK
jgi:hypothetical protein